MSAITNDAEAVIEMIEYGASVSDVVAWLEERDARLRAEASTAAQHTATALTRIRDFVKDLNTPPVPMGDKEHMQGYYFALRQVEQAQAQQHSVAQHTAQCNSTAHNK